MKLIKIDVLHITGLEALKSKPFLVKYLWSYQFESYFVPFFVSHLTISCSPEYSLFVGDITDDVDDLQLYSTFAKRYKSCQAAKGELKHVDFKLLNVFLNL